MMAASNVSQAMLPLIGFPLVDARGAVVLWEDSSYSIRLEEGRALPSLWIHSSAADLERDGRGYARVSTEGDWPYIFHRVLRDIRGEEQK